MAANQTFREIQDNVLALLSKSDAVTRNRVKNWINLGYYDFTLREVWPFRESTGTLATVAGTQEYDLSNNFSDIDEQNIISVAIQGDSNSKLPYWPYNKLRASEPDFDYYTQGLPERYYLKGGKIGLWPNPGAVYSIAIDYFSVPTELSADADTPSIPIAYREALVQYALSLEHDYNNDPDLAQKAMNRYEQIVTLARNNLLVQPIDTEAFRILGPADAINHTGFSQEVI